MKYVIGQARNTRLEKELQKATMRAKERQCLCGGSVRCYEDFMYRTRKSWSCSRRVIGKAEVTPQGTNPRFVLTDLEEAIDATDIYENIYCQRGQMENIIKQQQLDLKADRTSTAYLASNQLRLWFSTLAYLMLDRLRRWGLLGTFLERASVGTVRLRLLKIATEARVSVRRVYFRLSSSYPLQEIWQKCAQRLSQIPLYAPSG